MPCGVCGEWSVGEQLEAIGRHDQMQKTALLQIEQLLDTSRRARLVRLARKQPPLHR
jgi:hypothetical protein